MSPLALLPWKTRVAALVACPLLLVGPTLLHHGSASEVDSTLPTVMSLGWVLAAWLVAAPFGAVEVAASVTGHRWVSRGCAVAAVFVLAAVASLPVLLRFGPPEPTGSEWSLMAAHTYGVLLRGFLVQSTAACLLPAARRHAHALAAS